MLKKKNKFGRIYSVKGGFRIPTAVEIELNVINKATFFQ